MNGLYVEVEVEVEVAVGVLEEDTTTLLFPLIAFTFSFSFSVSITLVPAVEGLLNRNVDTNLEGDLTVTGPIDPAGPVGPFSSVGPVEAVEAVDLKSGLLAAERRRWMSGTRTKGVFFSMFDMCLLFTFESLGGAGAEEGAEEGMAEGVVKGDIGIEFDLTDFLHSTKSPSFPLFI